MSILAVDFAVKKVFLLTDTLDVVAAHEVLLDQLGYGTRAGHFSLGEEATIPVQIILHALDTCLEGLVQAGVDLSTVRAVSGAAAQATVIYLNSSFEASLASLANKEHLRLSQHFVRAFASTTTPICLDASTVAQARAFGRCIPAATSIDITGSAQPYRSPALQLMKILQTESTCIDTTSHIMLASTFIASAFLGSVAPQDEADACSSGLYDIRKRCWSRDVIDAVLRAAGETRSGRTEGLVLKLGEVERDGGKSLGRVSPYFVKRFGFAADCVVCTFTGDNPAMTLSVPLKRYDAIVSLGLGQTDTAIRRIPTYATDKDWHIFRHPAAAPDSSAFFAMVTCLDASLARAFIRDTYADSSWQIFSSLAGRTCQGGSIGLDDKSFLFFFSQGEPSNWKGICRFEAGRRVTDFKDRQNNPRLVLETTFLSFRIRLAEAYRCATRRLEVNNFSHSFLPRRLFIAGAASRNTSFTSILSDILGAPAYRHAPSRMSGMSITEPARGAANKAAWCWSRSVHGDEACGSFETFMKSKARALVQVAQPDEDVFQIYGASVDEYCRLQDALNIGAL